MDKYITYAYIRPNHVVGVLFAFISSNQSYQVSMQPRP
jgi:hypothetical protein